MFMQASGICKAGHTYRIRRPFIKWRENRWWAKHDNCEEN